MLLLFYGYDFVSWNHCRKCLCIDCFRVNLIFYIYRNFVKGINGTSCTLFKLHRTVVNGENTSVTPKWIGISTLENALTQTTLVIDDVQKNVSKLYQSSLQNDTNTFTSLLFDLSEEYNNNINKFTKNNSVSINNFTLINPSNSANNSFLVPKYIERLGSYKNPDSYLSQINDEHILIMEPGLVFLNEMKNASSSLQNQSDEVKSSLSTSINDLNQIQSTFDDLSSDIFDEIIKYQNYINDYSDLVFYVLTGIFMFFGVVGFLCTFFFVLCEKCQCIRIFLHILWNFLAFFSFILMLLGGIIGLVGIVLTDGVGVLDYVVSPENLTPQEEGLSPIILSGESLDYINTCLNGDGNLYDKFGLKDSSNIDQLYLMNKKVTEYAALVSSYNDSYNSTIQLDKYYKEVFEDFSKTHAEVKNAFDNLNKLTQNNSLTDTWVSNESYCPNKPDIFPNETNNTSGNYCFVLYSHITNESIKLRYENTTITESINLLKQYNDSNYYLLSNAIEQNNNFKNISNLLLKQLKNDVDISKNITQPLTNIFSQYTGDEGINSLMNCSKIFNY